jgi:RES domain-containing protein
MLEKDPSHARYAPHPESARLSRAVQRCVPRARSWSGVAYRVARPRYANATDLLSGAGSRDCGGRWNPLASFATVYASLELETALDEFLEQQRQNGFSIAQALPLVVAAFRVRLERVLDLTDGHVRRSLEISLARIAREPWRVMQDCGEEAITQAIGRIARVSGFEGLLVPSLARAHGTNLAVFPDRLQERSQLDIINVDELPPKVHKR